MAAACIYFVMEKHRNYWVPSNLITQIRIFRFDGLQMLSRPPLRRALCQKWNTPLTMSPSGAHPKRAHKNRGKKVEVNSEVNTYISSKIV